MKINSKGLLFLLSLIIMVVSGWYFGFEFKIFGLRYFLIGLRYDYKLLIPFVISFGLLFYWIRKAITSGVGIYFLNRSSKWLLIFAILLVSGTGPGIGIENNQPRVWNVVLFGAKHDGSTDDTQSIQNAVNACVAARGGKVYFPLGTYIIAGAIQTNVGGVDMNCQIYIPLAPTIYNVVTVNFVGESSASPGNIIQTPFATQSFTDMGVVLYSTYTGTRSTVNKGTAIIGTGEASPGAFNFNSFTLTNINFKTKFNPNGAGPEIGGANGRNALGFSFDNCTYTADSVITSWVMPTRDISGFETPETGGGASYVASNSSAAGIKWGMIFGEHVSGNQVTASACYYGFGMKPGGHASTFQRLNAYWCTNGINWYPFAANETSTDVFNIDEYDIEFGVGNTGKYYNTLFTLIDSTNKFLANINYAVITQGIGLNNSSWSMKGGNTVIAQTVGSFNPGKVGIGTNTPGTLLDIVGSTNAAIAIREKNNTSGTAAQTEIQLLENTGAGMTISQLSPLTTTYGNLVAEASTFYNNTAGGLAFMTDFASGITFWTGTVAGSGATRLNITSTGNVTIAGSESHNVTDISATGTYNATATDYTIQFTGTTATLVYPSVNLVNGRHLNIVNNASGSVTIPSTKTGNASTITSLTTGTRIQVEYDLANTTWIQVN